LILFFLFFFYIFFIPITFQGLIFEPISKNSTFALTCSNMNQRFPEYSQLQMVALAESMQQFWKDDQTFQKSIQQRLENKPFVFFEGPPSANGKPGIHHVMARAIKDIFCRFKTLDGYRVERKAGWDTHGLPVELGVEKTLGITKEDIGKKITIEEYNQACRTTVMQYTDEWNRLTEMMGYWVDMEQPYLTYHNKYMESVWWLLAQVYNKNLLYKGYTIQPYSPAAGTGLSSHELNQPGCYREVKDTSVVAMFEMKESSRGKFETAAGKTQGKIHFLAWTTTPWTLPSNTALTVGPNITYALVQTLNPYTQETIQVVLAEALIAYQFGGKFQKVETAEASLQPTEDGKTPFFIHSTFKGKTLLGIQYHQLLPWVQPMENADRAFQIITGDFVTTEDGTGIVHTAPTFGADDAKVAKEHGVPPMLVFDENGNPTPLVDLQGKFTSHCGPMAGKYVKIEYYPEDQKPEQSADVEIAVGLKTDGKAFKVEKYSHNYPHCWRTDKPVLYYPLDSWFIRMTQVRERMTELNQSIGWKPESTGTGRFGNWLESCNDWNLSRSRFWGIPLPIWRTEDGSETLCVDSVETLINHIQKSIQHGLMSSNPLEGFEIGNLSDENYQRIDLHKNVVDQIVLMSSNGQPMFREADLIDVWFDSGAMPYAQWHYPFENKEKIDGNFSFPADFIAEGVDQTRGWFYTLHAIATLVFDGVAYKNVVSNGLVLDKFGQKMSKRLGNAVDPFDTLSKYGPDATRWYMITNAQPWDNLRFDENGITEAHRKFFGTWYNTYAFFALYANIDGFDIQSKAVENRPEMDQWILSKLSTLQQLVMDRMNDFDPTPAGRALEDFVDRDLSNWYVRLNRRRFWKGEMNEDKLSAYQTLHRVLSTLAQLASPFAPFFSDWMWQNLNGKGNSVHLTHFPTLSSKEVDADLEQKMDFAQTISSMVLSLRKKEKIRVRQPLSRILIPADSPSMKLQIEAVSSIILAEVNVKSLEFMEDTAGVVVKKIKPNFKSLGARMGGKMKAVAGAISGMEQNEIRTLEKAGQFELMVEGENMNIELNDVEIISEDIPGWLVAVEGNITVALDIHISENLRKEGLAREFINRVQNFRKSSGLEVTDRIRLSFHTSEGIKDAIIEFQNYICEEVLADELFFVSEFQADKGTSVELEDDNLWLMLM
jgi:isoleucyl-tRNA synthetase